MEFQSFGNLLERALLLACLFSALVLIPGFVMAFLSGLLQAATSIQDQVLGFVPKLLVTGAVLYLSSGWMLERLNELTRDAILAMEEESGGATGAKAGL